MSATVDRDLGLRTLAGEGGCRTGTADDAIDDIQPRYVVDPVTPEALAAVLGWCSTHRQSVVIKGGGSKMAWGRRPAPIDVVLSTRRLGRVIRHEPGDLTATVEAGMAISDLNRELTRHRQWLPLDARSAAATVGGAIATNDSGPLRHRYGAARDQLIGIRVATADGRLASAGGNVVKNVAGYDLGKLVAGSFGGLAAIVSATFKLAPVPASSTTLVLSFGRPDDLGAAAAGISASQLDPLSIEADAKWGSRETDGAVSWRLLVRFAGSPAAVEEQVAGAEALARPSVPTSTERRVDAADAELWIGRSRSMWEGPGAVVRASWMPAALPRVFALVGEACREANLVEADLAGRAALGAGFIRLAGDTASQAAAIARLRGRQDVVTHVVVAKGDIELRASADVWGEPGSAAVIAGAVKRKLDPAGILNAARGPV
jgi:glycolate dehydrogenase FAD-binding subunit